MARSFPETTSAVGKPDGGKTPTPSKPQGQPNFGRP